MAYYQNCLRFVPKEEMVCQICGSEKGYVYFYKKARGRLFLFSFGILLPMAIIICEPFCFHDFDVYFWMVLAIASGLGIFSTYKLVVGPVWYR